MKKSRVPGTSKDTIWLVGRDELEAAFALGVAKALQAVVAEWSFIHPEDEEEITKLCEQLRREGVRA